MYGSGISEVDIVYRPGKNCANADALSRSSQQQLCQTVKMTSQNNSLPKLMKTHPRMLHFLPICVHFLADKVLPTDAHSARKIALQAPLFTILDGILYFVDAKQVARKEQLYLII